MKLRDRISIPILILQTMGLLVVTVTGMGAACDGDDGFDTEGTDDTEGADDTLGPQPDLGNSSTGTTTGSDTDPTPPTGDESGSPSTTDPDTGTDTSSGGCLASGTYTTRLVDRVDPLGHFEFLKLWFSPRSPDQSIDEVMECEVEADGTITISVLPRALGSGEGHAGLLDLVGTIDADCEVDVATQVAFSSDTGPFGTIDVEIQGSFGAPEAGGPVPSAQVVLQGGSIPQGPITYSLEFTLID